MRKKKEVEEMGGLLYRFISFVFTLVVFIILWKVYTFLWGAYIPWNYKTDILGLFIGTPVLIILSVILSSLTFKFIRESR